MNLRDMTSPDVIESEVLCYGILPFFINRIEGFSIAEHTPEDLWFNDNVDGPWEWKGPIISRMTCAYGKFFEQKAGYISLALLPHLINIRRSVYPISRMTETERRLYDTLLENESMRSDFLREKSGLWPKKSTSKKEINPFDILDSKKKNSKNKTESFDTAIMKLQMSTWIVTGDFEYNYTKEGKRYGWGKSVYVSPEAMYGDEITDAEGMSADESMDYICKYISDRTNAEYNVIRKMMTWKI